MAFLLKRFSFLLISFFILSFIFSPLTKTVLAGAPSDVFNNVTLDSLSQEEASARQKDKPGGIQLFDLRTVTRQLDLMFFGIINKIICAFTIPALCGDQPRALDTIGILIAKTYDNPPASGIAYTRDLLANAGILAKPVYAQGIGFSSLGFLLPLWKTTRNIAYTVLIIVMVIIGFMIIFRMKIDPKTVISVQAALPKIILTLILITFSYAIVGFMIDVMYLVMAILISVIAKGMGPEFAKNIPAWQTQLMNGGVAELAGWVFGTGIFNIGELGSGLADDIFKVTITPGAIIALLIKIAAGISFLWALALAGIAITLFLVLGLLYSFIRILLLLFNSYIQLMLSLILGPLLLLKEAIPGQSGFSQWILNVMGNLSVFPTTAVILIFASYLASLNTTTFNSVVGTGAKPMGTLWSPPLTFAGGDFFPAILALSVIFMAPTLIASVKKVFHTKPTLPITSGTVFSPLTGGIQTGMGAMQSFYYLQSMTEHGFLAGMLSKLPGVGKGHGPPGK